jgi:diguanylate cyclase
MDVNRADAVTPAGAGGGPKQERKRTAEEEKQDKSAGGGDPQPSPWSGSEAFAMEGLLAGGMTPEIQTAFDNLARQIEPLRAEVDRARGREAHFKELAEKHSFLPVASRREFLRELAHLLNNMQHLTPLPNLMVLHVLNADDVRLRFGRHALDGLLVHVCEAVRERLHPTDVLGSLGGNDFGIILLAGDQERAGAKVAELTEALAAQPFFWRGGTVPVAVAAGVAAITPASTADAAVEAADRDLIGRLAAAAGTGKTVANG